MNLPGIEWPSTSIKPNWPSPAQHNLFIDILANHGMSQIVDQWTRGKNTLDLIAVNYLTLANRTEILPGISDHDAVFAEIDIRAKRYGQAKRKIPLYKKADLEGIVSQIITTNQYIQEHADSESTNSLWNKFKSDLHTAIEKHVPHKCCSSRNRHQWISAKIRNLLRSRNRLYRKSKIRRETRAIRIMWKPTSFLKHQMSQIEVTLTSVMCYKLHGAGTPSPMVTSCTTRSLSIICIMYNLHSSGISYKNQMLSRVCYFME